MYIFLVWKHIIIINTYLQNLHICTVIYNHVVNLPIITRFCSPLHDMIGSVVICITRVTQWVLKMPSLIHRWGKGLSAVWHRSTPFVGLHALSVRVCECIHYDTCHTQSYVTVWWWSDTLWWAGQLWASVVGASLAWNTRVSSLPLWWRTSGLPRHIVHETDSSTQFG